MPPWVATQSAAVGSHPELPMWVATQNAAGLWVLVRQAMTVAKMALLKPHRSGSARACQLRDAARHLADGGSGEVAKGRAQPLAKSGQSGTVTLPPNLETAVSKIGNPPGLETLAGLDGRMPIRPVGLGPCYGTYALTRTV